MCSLRIAIVRSSLHKGSGQVTHIAKLVKGLQNLGHKAVVFSREVEITKEKMPIQELTFFGDNVPFFRNFIFPFRCSSSLGKFDIVHTQYQPCIYVGNMAKRMLGKPHVFTYHGFAPVKIWKKPKQRIKMVDHRVETFFSLRFGVDRIISVSQYLKRELVNSYKFREDLIRVIYNGVDTEVFNPQVDGSEIRQKYGLRTDPVVLYLGRLAPYKGVQYLIKAIPLILKARPNTKFLIAGSGRYDMLNLQAMAESQGVGKSVVFTGFVPNELIPKFFACCDIFCFPSMWEGFGLPVAEAGATGKPVVAFRRCAIPEIIKHGTTGLLVEPDHGQLANSIITLLEDEKMRKKMGMAARNRVSRLFSWQKMAEQTLEVYQEASG